MIDILKIAAGVVIGGVGVMFLAEISNYIDARWRRLKRRLHDD